MRRYNKLITALVLTFGISALFTACGSDAGKEPVAETVTEAPKEIVDSELYDSFMNNEAKVLYRGTNGIKTVFANLATALEEGQAYTIKQIVFLLQTKSGVPDKIEPEIKSERIDCGGDGVQELMVDMTFGGTGLYMVIKDIDGELNLCFAEDYSVSGENVIGKTEVKLNPDGTVSRTIEAKGNNGYEEYSVIDGSGEFHR